MKLSVTTDYHVDAAIPRLDQMRRMRAAGFEQVHWCYDWSDDVRYGEEGLAEARRLFADADLKLLDTHGVCWGGARDADPDPDKRRHALALHEDRLRWTAGLGGDVVVLHPAGGEDLAAGVDRLVANVEALVPVCHELGMLLAIENLADAAGNRANIPRLLETFEPEVMGFCFDSGHANMAGDTDWLIEHAFSRLNALHLHDNDGQRDLHQIPGMGTVDWAKVVEAIAAVGYAKPINFELSMTRSGYDDETAFLAAAYKAGARLFSG